MTSPDLTELRSIAVDASARIGGEVAKRRQVDFSWSTKSSRSDVVTEIDTWSELAIVDDISKRRPDDGFLGEEGTSRPSRSGVTWIIDPVDGTTNLLYDLPGYSVSIAAEFEGSVIAGAVYDPIRLEVFSAATAQGATRDGDPISVSTKADLETALVGIGFSYDADQRVRQAEQLREILPVVRDVRRMGGAALDLCSVACGRLDAYFERGLSPWDSAAGGLISSEAGADVTTGDLTTAATPGIAKAFQQLLTDVGA